MTLEELAEYNESEARWWTARRAEGAERVRLAPKVQMLSPSSPGGLLNTWLFIRPLSAGDLKEPERLYEEPLTPKQLVLTGVVTFGFVLRLVWQLFACRKVLRKQRAEVRECLRAEAEKRRDVANLRYDLEHPDEPARYLTEERLEEAQR